MGGRRMHWAHPARWLQFRLRTLLLMVTVAGLCVFGYQHWKWAQNGRVVEWLDAALVVPTPLQGRTTRLVYSQFQTSPTLSLPTCPFDLTHEEEIEMLIYGATHLENEPHRFAAMRLLFEMYQDDRVEAMRLVAKRSWYEDTRLMALQIIGLNHNRDDLEFVERFVHHKSLNTRIAATDAISLIVDDRLPPRYGARISDVAIDGKRLAWRGGHDFVSTVALISSNKDMRGQRDDLLRAMLLERMATSTSAEERSAAARGVACLTPTSDELRVAEVGLWFEPKRVDELVHLSPPFTGRRTSAYPVVSDASILLIGRSTTYFSVDEPLAIDLNYRQRFGSPMRKFPAESNARYTWLPTDALVSSSTFPWNARFIGGTPTFSADWKALIVMPEKPTWYTPPTRDRGGWWGDAECGTTYLSDDDECSRFLFQAAWTAARSPVRVTIEGNRLLTHKRNMLPGYRYNGNDPAMTAIPDATHGMFVDVTKERTTAAIVATPELDHAFDFDQLEFTRIDAAKRALSQLLVGRGLTPAEANGFVARESSQIFAAPGRRYLTIVNRVATDCISSITIDPPPTTHEARPHRRNRD